MYLQLVICWYKTCRVAYSLFAGILTAVYFLYSGTVHAYNHFLLVIYYMVFVRFTFRKTNKITFIFLKNTKQQMRHYLDLSLKKIWGKPCWHFRKSGLISQDIFLGRNRKNLSSCISRKKSFYISIKCAAALFYAFFLLYSLKMPSKKYGLILMY